MTLLQWSLLSELSSQSQAAITYLFRETSTNGMKFNVSFDIYTKPTSKKNKH